MPTPTIPDGELFFNPVLWTGNGTSQTITGLNFQPDFVWVKIRGATSGQHVLTDVVRGNDKQLFSSLTNAEQTESGKGVTSFNSNGFSVTELSGTGSVNQNAGTFVGWSWKAGGAAVTNTAGSISSQVSANTTAGFSVVAYTGNGTSGATVGHGLGVAPSFIIAKNRNNGATDWPTFHVSTGNNGGCTLNESAAKATTAIWWNNTTPTSSVVTLGSGAQTNGSGNGIVLYCWAQIAGFSSFGSYTGNGSTDGPFVYTGFRPRFLLIKVTSTTGSWTIVDTARDPFNLATDGLYPDLSQAEDTSRTIDILSNGFKFRSAANNISGATFIYAAFAENPFKYANAR